MIFVGFLIFIVVFFTKEDSLENYSGTTMGTYYNVSIASSSNENRGLMIKRTLEKVNQEMSTYIESSFLSIFNNTPVGVWIDSPTTFLKVLNQAIEICKLSNGYFDVTAGDLVNIWGFGPSEVFDPPKQNQIANSLKKIGCDSVSADNLNGKVKRDKDVQTDFSALAKGFAIDQLFNELLKDKSITGFLIEVGGEIKVYGYKSKNKPWSVGISHPDIPDQSIFKINKNIKKYFSMATSGDYRNFKVFGGKAVSHTIDTKKGTPIEVRRSSVSVIDGSAMKADALATALNAMGPNQGLNFANKNNIEAIFIIKEKEEYIIEFSESFKKTLQ